jgi:4-amino-4-deoxy-L-arabinose transferase-like glycosyltransferase
MDTLDTHDILDPVKTNLRFILISTTIVCLAAYLRLNRLDLIDFRFDQAYPLQYALDIVEGRKLWLVQPHGSVAQHPPIYLYFIALGLLFTRNFMAMVVYRVLWDVLAVVLCGWFCARYFNRRVAGIAMLLYAVAPWAIQFSRNLWPVPQPLFTMILLIGLVEVVTLKNARGWFWIAVGIGLVAGTHLAGVYVLPAVIVIILFALRSFKVTPFALGTVVPAFAFGAYFFHDAQNGFDNTKNLVSTFGSPSHFDLRPMWQALNLSGGTKLSDLTGISYPKWVAETPRGFEYIDTLQIALFVASVIVVSFFVFHHATRRESRSAFVAASTVVLLFWTLTLAIQLRQNDTRPT